MELTIDLKLLKKSGLFLEEFVIMALINSGENIEEYHYSKHILQFRRQYVYKTIRK